MLGSSFEINMLLNENLAGHFYEYISGKLLFSARAWVETACLSSLMNELLTSN